MEYAILIIDMLARIFSNQDEANHQCLELEACLAFGSEIGREHGGNPDEWNWSDIKFLCFPDNTIEWLHALIF